MAIGFDPKTLENDGVAVMDVYTLISKACCTNVE